MKNIFLFISFITIFIFCTGCGGDYIFKKDLKIKNGKWYYENKLDFDFIIEDTLKKYDLFLDVHHAGNYGFQNLYVQFHTTYPSGEKKTQTVSLELASKSGIWNGECSGNECNVEIPLQVNASFNEPGKHIISIEQYMRKNPLPGIKEMVLKIAEKEEL